MSRGKTTVAVAALVFAAIGLIVLASSRSLRIQYHWWRWQSVHDDIWSAAPNPSISESQNERFEHHRDELVKLGILFHRTYSIEHIDEKEGARSVFIRILLDLHPGVPPPLTPYWEGAYPTGPIDVWDLADNKAEWDAFFQTHNTPEFAVEHADEIESWQSERNR